MAELKFSTRILIYSWVTGKTFEKVIGLQMQFHSELKKKEKENSEKRFIYRHLTFRI